MPQLIKYPDICQEYSKKYSFVKYYRNDQNLGSDLNCVCLINRANSEYLWISSDDDILCNDSGLKMMVDYLNIYDVEFLFLNYVGSVILDDDVPEYVKDGNEFFKATKFKGGFLTSCVVKVDTWKKISMERFYGSQWLQLAYQAFALSPKNEKCSAGIIKKEIIKALPIPQSVIATHHSWGRGGTFIITGLKAVEQIFSNFKELGYTDEVQEMSIRCIYGYGLHYTKWLILARLFGLRIDKNLYLRLEKDFGQYKSFKYLNKYVCLCPSIIFDVVRYTLFIPLLHIRRFIKKIMKK